MGGGKVREMRNRTGKGRSRGGWETRSRMERKFYLPIHIAFIILFNT